MKLNLLHVSQLVNEMAGDLFTEMETDVFFDIKMVTTDKLQRRGGLATDLLRRSVELGINLGFKAVKTQAKYFPNKIKYLATFLSLLSAADTK